MNIEKEARKWIEDNYPLMNANNFDDCDELDVYDMISFAQHIKEKLEQRSNPVSLKRFVIGIKESDGKPMQFFKGIDPPDGPLGEYVRADYSLEDAVEFENEKEAIAKAKYLEENYGPHYCYVLTVNPVS